MNNILKISCILTTALTMAQYSLAAEAAANPETNMYITLGAAAALSGKDLQTVAAQDGSQYSALTRKSMWLYRAAIGGNISENMRSELEFIIFDRYKTNWLYNAVPSITAHSKLLSQAYFINGYYDFHKLIPIATPYIGAGIGGAYNSVNDTPLSNGQTIYRKATYDFAWNLGFGAIYNFNQNFYFDMNYRYIYSGKFKGNPVSATVNKPILRGHVYNHSFLASFGVKL